MSFTIDRLKGFSGYREDLQGTPVEKNSFVSKKVVLAGDDLIAVDQSSGEWMGHLLSWVQPSAPGGAQEKERKSNILLREKIHASLREVLNHHNADAVLRAVLGPASSGAPITKMQIRQIIGRAEELRREKMLENKRYVETIIQNFPGGTAQEKCLTIDGVSVDKAIFKKDLLKALTRHPGYKKEALTAQELTQIKDEVIAEYCQESPKKLQEAFPFLTQGLRENLPPTAEDFITGVKSFLQKEASSAQTVVFKKSALEALDGIAQAHALLAQMEFDPSKALLLRASLEEHRQKLSDLQQQLHALPEEEASRLTKPVEGFRKKLCDELTAQSDRLTLQEAAVTHYIENDPFSDHNVLYPRRVYAEAFKKLGDQLLLELATSIQHDEAKTESITERAKIDRAKSRYQILQARINEWYKEEVAAYEEAPHTRSRTPEFYKTNKTEQNSIRAFTAGRAFMALKDCCSAAKTSLPFSMVAMNDAKVQVMNEELDWNPVVRDMTVSLNGRTRHYRQTSTPISQSATAIGATMRKEGVGGIIPAARADGRFPINARMTIVVRVKKDGTPGVPLRERQQHGINDHYHIIDEEERAAANRESARQLIQHGIETDPDFVLTALGTTEEATPQGEFSISELESDLETASMSESPTVSSENDDWVSVSSEPLTPFKVFYINTNLTTPTYTPRDLPWGQGTHDERTYSEKQAVAFREVSGADQVFQVRHPETGETKPITVDVEFIDFRFPVNYALDDSIDPGLIQAWRDLKVHNEAEFIKLFGSLQVSSTVGGLMGPTYEKLTNLSMDASKSPEIRHAAHDLISGIDEQCLHLRTMFQKGDYKSAQGDRFKMPRHIDLLVNKFREATRLVGDMNLRVVNAGGCMSGKDREGVANAEAEAAAIIEDMGGNVTPGHHFNQEERTIYNVCVTGVVNNTLQMTGFGGSKNAGEVHDRMLGESPTDQERHALEVASGLSKNADT